ncbi:hypothetical protein [Flavobacterium haoranii]|uniref:Uncharacterized protein n=1 Tax=Flavobacterium haoranii TaxID=683124 RepID=A0A1M6FAE0_9FLAO|nr:hypothetical protein [Flavobacterium haoranii]SHI94635.1 hypothetical protein SAMN05444337_1170 [Flavobacterium haoranii]
MNLHKLTKIAAIIVAVLSIIFLGLLMANSDAEDNSWISPLIYISYAIFAACVVVVLVFVLKNLFTHKEDLKRTLISVGLFLGVVLISYIFADSSDVKANGIVYTGATSKWVSAGLNAFYLLAVVAVGAMVWTGFNKIKK